MEKANGYLQCWVTVREDGTLSIILPDFEDMPKGELRDTLKKVATKVPGDNSDTYNLESPGQIWFREWHWKLESSAGR